MTSIKKILPDNLKPLCCASVVMLMSVSAVQAAEAGNELFNTVKQKLARGEQVVGGTVGTSDVEIYCAMANSGFDFLGSAFDFICCALSDDDVSASEGSADVDPARVAAAFSSSDVTEVGSLSSTSL